MSLENIPDKIVREDLTNYLNSRDSLNYNHIFYKIGEGNIFYPEYYLSLDNDDINLYGGCCEDGLIHRLKYNIDKKEYIFYYEEEDDIYIKFITSSWNEIYQYINIYFEYYVSNY